MTISNYDLEQLFVKYKIPMTNDDIIMSNQLKNRPLKNGAIIINLDNPINNGSHWVCVYINLHEKLAFYFDSYGALCDRYIITYCKKHKLSLAYNRYIIQSLKSTECGIYCFKLIKFIFSEAINTDVPREFESNLLEICNDYINLFVSDPYENDAILKNI